MRAPIVYLITMVLTAGAIGCGDDVKKPSGNDPDQTIVKKDMTYTPTPDMGVEDSAVIEPDMSEPEPDTMVPDMMKPDMMLTECGAEPDGTPCGDQTTAPCDAPDTCQGGICVDNAGAVGDPCGDSSDTVCTDPDTCNASGVCLPNDELDGAACGEGGQSVCDEPNTCLSGACVDNYEVSGTICGDTEDTDCTDPDACDGFGNCLINDEPADTPCGDTADTDCTDPDTCDGDGVCETHDLAVDAPCGDLTESECDAADTCDEAGVCQPNNIGSGQPCGSPTVTECNGADTCDESGVCQPNQVAVDGPCGDQTHTLCNEPDSCDAAGECQPNLASLHTTCGSTVDTDCTDPDECDGMGACRANHAAPGALCGDTTARDCDNPDTCDGSGGCNTNLAAEGDPCGDPSEADCDSPDTCDASQQCLPNIAADGLSCFDCINFPGECDQCIEGACLDLGPCGYVDEPSSIRIPFNNDNANWGNMFDVEILGDMVIQSFDVNISSDGPDVDVAVYYRIGTCEDNHADPDGWTYLDTATVTAQGEGMPTPLNMNLGLYLAAGKTVSFYITITNFSAGAFLMHYTNGTAFGTLLGENTALRVFEGYGTGNSLFPSNVANPRAWNGNIYYSYMDNYNDTLPTSFNGADPTDGSMFDVVAKHEVNITGIQTNLPAGDHDVEIYFRPGTHVGFEADALGWIPLVATTVTSVAAGAGTAIVFPASVRILGGATYAFYVTTTGATAMLTYAGTGVGNMITEDFNLEIYEGTGVTYPFGATSAPEVFNGVLEFEGCDLRPD